jgi:ubiquinone/menaquinone biosynthesis C-methylase UbiE
MTGVHQSAQKGFSTQATTYTQGRPDYPEALKTWLAKSLAIGADSSVIDLGAGTGKFTRLLTAITPNILAVEPVAAMRAEFIKNLPALRVLEGTAEAIPCEAQVADAVTCAQAFHWFASEAALAEIHRVLKPAGQLGLIWNVRDESVDWVAALTEIMTPFEGDTPRFHNGKWREAFTGRYFSAPQLSCFSYSHVGTAEEVIFKRVMSVSFIAALPAGQNEGVARQVRDLIAGHPALRDGQTVAFPYQTQAYRYQRLA